MRQIAQLEPERGQQQEVQGPAPNADRLREQRRNERVENGDGVSVWLEDVLIDEKEAETVGQGRQVGGAAQVMSHHCARIIAR